MSCCPLVQYRNNIHYFYGYMDFQQMPVMIDILRNEKPLNFIWSEVSPNLYHLSSGEEPIGEGDG
ncbi:MAG: hypothetical protein AAF985_27035 [Bacteroidota bacterium]